MATIHERVRESGEAIRDDELVNLGRTVRDLIAPSTGPRSYWFRYGDVKHLTVVQLQAVAIGQLASAGEPGGANVLRISMLDEDQFVARSPTNFSGIGEYTIDSPVHVRTCVFIAP